MRPIVHLMLLIATGCVLFAASVDAQSNVYGGYGPGVALNENGRADGRWIDHEAIIATRAELTRCCPVVSIRSCAVENTGRLPDRYTLRITRLGTIEAQPLLMFRYRRETLFQDPAFAGVDRERQPYFPCRASRVVLALETADGRYRIIWQGTQDELSYRLETVALYHREKNHILAFTYCVDGTGGCWQELFIKTSAATWRPLEKDGSWEPVYADMPDGYALHKSPTIEFDTMTWDRAIATLGDANCCPSGTIKMKLAVRHDRLAVLSHQYVLDPIDKD